jgi:hypothetical protein
MRFVGIAQRKLSGIAVVAVAMSLGLGSPAGAQPLRKDLSSYFVFAQRNASLKNLHLNDRCNVGVGCSQPSANSSCGVVNLDDVLFGDGSQIAGDVVKIRSGGNVFQVFRNSVNALAGVVIRQPPIQALPDPIIPGSCGQGCSTNPTPLEAACGFPNPFPACNAGAPITVAVGKDCKGDTNSGNGRCDLPPGTYGAIEVQNGASLTLSSGTYVACSFRVGKNAEVLGSASLILIPEGGFFRVNNSSLVGQQCGDITVFIKGVGDVSLGKGSTIAAKVCAPQSTIGLGNGNQLTGQFIGDTVNADFGNNAQCCDRCTCFSDFTPKVAKVGDVVTLTGGCDMTNAQAVRICDIPAPIISKNANEVRVTVPAGASGQCVVELDSGPGTFTINTTLLVM